jgi:integrase
VALLREIIGDSCPVPEINYDVCVRVRSLLARIPANRNKIYNGLSVEDAITRANAEGKALLSAFTQERYLATLRDILKLALNKRLVPVNYAADLKPLKRDRVAASARRLSFTPKQLKMFFEGSFYRACAQHSPPYSFDKNGWRFWLPPMCLFMGMRPNEACQMAATEIRVTDAGTWYADIVASDDDDIADGKPPRKTVKTETSRRRVPIHPVLIEIGFLQFVDSRLKSGSDARLFPSLKGHVEKLDAAVACL